MLVKLPLERSVAKGQSVQRRVLVADEDPQIGRLLKHYLEREGFTLT